MFERFEDNQSALELGTSRENVLRSPNPIFFRLFLYTTLGLYIYKVSQAGYFISDTYSQLLELGYASENSGIDSTDSFSFIGTIATAFLIAVAPWAFLHLRGKIPLSISSLLLIQLYVVFTGTWSAVRNETIVAALHDIVFLVDLYFIISVIGYHKSIEVVAFTALIIGVCSIYLSMTNPLFSFSGLAPGWRGLFATKNSLGTFCLCIYLFIFPCLLCGINKTLLIITSSIMLVLIILSQDKTALALVVTFSVAALAYRRTAFSGRGIASPRLVALYGGITLMVGAVVGIGLISGGVTDFTGRVDLWAYFIGLLEGATFIFGLGGQTVSLDVDIADAALRAVGNAGPDSSLVTILCNQGILGLLIFAGLSFVWMRHLSGRRTYISGTSVLAYVCLVFLAALESGMQYLATMPFSLVVLLLAIVDSESLPELESREVVLDEEVLL